MDVFVDAAMSFIGRCDQHVTLATLTDDFSKVLKQFGFDYFMMTRLPALGESAEPYIIAHTWPDVWLNRYREQNYFWHDPVSAFSLSQARPFTWSEARSGSPDTRVARQLASEARSSGLKDGFGFPLGDPASIQSVVSLGSDQLVDLPPLARILLEESCRRAQFRAVELHDKVAKRFTALTAREREVLRWIANGKSFADTAQILSISPRSVETHVMHARVKLNAQNVAHAVGKAVKAREIIL